MNYLSTIPLWAWICWPCVTAALVYLMREAEIGAEWKKELAERHPFYRKMRACSPCCAAWASPVALMVVAPAVFGQPRDALIWFVVAVAPLSMTGFFYLVSQLSLLSGWAAMMKKRDGA